MRKPTLIAILLLLAQEQGAAQEPCLTEARGARMQSQIIDNQFTDPDPTWRPRLGLPDTIQSITWIQDSVVCVEALRRLRLVGDSLGWARYPIGATRKVFVFAVEPELYVVVGDGDLNMISFFTRRWRYIVTMAGLN